MRYRVIGLDIWQPYQKQQLTSRTYIRVSNRVLPLTVTVHRRDHHAPLWEQRISYQEDWPRQHLRTVESAYRSAPYFEYYIDALRAFWAAPEETLGALNMRSAKLMASWLQWSPVWHAWDRMQAPGEADDLRRLLMRHQWPDRWPMRTYFQVFPGFEPGLSALDLMLNLGPEAGQWLRAAGPPQLTGDTSDQSKEA
ncbi:MAG: WbqC family protein [Bacteroidia bacterium]|nr:WbqC family protein [Bacteroidia bacterium]